MVKKIIFVITLVSIFSVEAAIKQRSFYSRRPQKDVLLTYNKCGTHFCLYNIQYLTNRPIRNFSGSCLNFITGLKELEKPPIFHTHEGISVLKSNEIGRLIVLVRNPRELILRHFGFTQGKYLLEILVNNLPYDSSINIVYPVKAYVEGKPISWALTHIQSLLDIFKAFHNYNGQKKIMYYEDLIASPKNFMEKILLFLDEDMDKLKEFEVHLDQIKENCLEAYVKQFRAPKELITISDRTNPNYYQNKFSSIEIKEIQRLLLKFFPPEYHKYIQRFY